VTWFWNLKNIISAEPSRLFLWFWFIITFVFVLVGVIGIFNKWDELSGNVNSRALAIWILVFGGFQCYVIGAIGVVFSFITNELQQRVEITNKSL